MSPAAGPLSIFIVAGEPSGDVLGGRLMAALRRRSPRPVRFAGIGGDLMREQGLESLAPLADLAVMGVAEILPRLPRLREEHREDVAQVWRIGGYAVPLTAEELGLPKRA